jgi:hypothetical protein
MMKAPAHPTDRRRAALFVDFDNIYLGLKRIDIKAAEKFATDPSLWLNWFERGMPDHEEEDGILHLRRDLLLRRCYLNPRTFANYRGYFTASGFTVVDCPHITQQGKNSTDIHMVMDILDALKHDTQFDEFIILSGDSDFTPVLLRLRVYDRRTVILTTGPVAQAYKAASDYVISGDVFMEDGLEIFDEPVEDTRPQASPAGPGDDRVLDAMAKALLAAASAEGQVLAFKLPPLYRRFSQFKNSNNWLGFYSLRDLTADLVRRMPPLCLVEGDPSWKVSLRTSVSPAPPSPPDPGSIAAPAPDAGPSAGSLRDRILVRVEEIVAASPEPVNMASAAWDVIKNLGQEVTESRWAGAGSFKDLLLTADQLGFEIVTSPNDPGVLVDPQRHTYTPSGITSSRWSNLPVELKDFAHRINRVTGTPAMTPAEYSLVFKMLEESLKQSRYSLNTMSKVVRDRCIERGSPIARRAVNFILQGITYAGHVFDENPSRDTAENFAHTFKENVLALCRNAQLELSPEEREMLNQWICADDSSGLPHDSPAPPPDAQAAG